jgi:Tol biopolymer transport system component
VGFFLRAPKPARQIRFDFAAPDDLVFVGSPRISPDGRHVAFRATNSNGDRRVWARPLDSLDARPLQGTEWSTDFRPIWSPDSRYIAFFSRGKLKKVAIDGGPAQTISDASTGADGSWSTTGEILYDGGRGDPLRRVAASGGIAKAEVAGDSEPGMPSVGWPEFLPDGRRFLYLTSPDEGESKLVLAELDSDEVTELLEVDSRVQYVEPGYLLYVREDTLVAHPFDARSGEFTDEPMPLADEVGATAVGQADFSASHDGTLVYRTERGGVRQLVWRDRAGRELGTVGKPDAYVELWPSPDGGRVVVSVLDRQSEHQDLWVQDLERGVASRFTFDPGDDHAPLWSPDGSHIVYSSDRKGSCDLYLKSASGTGTVDELLVTEQNTHAADWSRDGRYVALAKRAGDNGWDIWALPMNPPGEAFPVVQSEFWEIRPNFSPDARWMAYESNESGRPEIYVTQFPGPGGKFQVSTDGGSEPRWSDDGRELFYLDETQHMVSVDVEAGDTFRAGLPETLFASRVFPSYRSRYLVSRDGQRFLMLSRMESQSNPPTTVVLNWHASLQR